MASADTIATTLSVRELLSLSDTELADFMKEHRSHEGDIKLPVDGWDDLSKDERALLAERLMAQERVLAQDPQVQSRPIDLDRLDELLLQATTSDKKRSSRTPEREISRSPTPSFDEESTARARETEAYRELVDQGGRPLYPIHLFGKVFDDPESHQELLRPWFHPSDPTSHRLFSRQSERWQRFREWQRDNRGIKDLDDGYAAHVEQVKRINKHDFTEIGYAKWLAELEADPLLLKPTWEFLHARRQRERSHTKEKGCHSLSDYEQAVAQRLSKHGFESSFHLKDDPEQQDKLTTWIEYLNFEYWWLDKHAKTIERLEPGHDKAWQELMDSGLFEPHETEEFLLSDASAMSDEAAKVQAGEAVNMAIAEGERVYAKTQLDSNRLDIPESERSRMLQQATADINTAKDTLQRFKDRESLFTNFLRKTTPLQEAKRAEASQKDLIPWVLEQVPLVEAEQVGTVGAAQDVGAERKRKLEATEDSVENEDTKRRKQDHDDLFPLSKGDADGPSRKPRPVSDTEDAMDPYRTAQDNISHSNSPEPSSQRAKRPEAQTKSSGVETTVPSVEDVCLSLGNAE